MPTRITIAEDRGATEPTTSSDPPQTGHAFTPSGGSGSKLDLFTPKGGASSPTPRFGLTRQAAKTLSSKNFGDGDGGRSAAKTKNLPSRPVPSRQVNDNGDIVASPRLLGYLLNFIASLICMVSAIKFERLSQQHYWFDLLVYFSDGRIDHNLTSTNLVMNSSSSSSSSSNGNGNSTRLLFVTSTVSHEEQQDFIKGPVASNIYEASMLYGVAVIVGGPETRLFNPHGVRFLQVDDLGKGDNGTLELSLLPTYNPSTSMPTEVPTSPPGEAETTIAPTNGPSALSELVIDAPTLLGIDSSTGPTPMPTKIGTGSNEIVVDASSSSTSPAPSAVTHVSSAAPTSSPTASNLTAISPIIDENSRPIRAVDYWVC